MELSQNAWIIISLALFLIIMIQTIFLVQKQYKLNRTQPTFKQLKSRVQTAHHNLEKTSEFLRALYKSLEELERGE